MPLRNQPYLPLYVQDFLTDEKLIECSAQATGVYIRLMCIMHKSEPYGTILLKQKDKQNSKQTKNFALKLAKHLPYDLNVIENSLDELISEGVLILDGDQIIQKRMVKDNYISDERAKAGSKGGKIAQAKPKAKVKPKHKAKPESEIDIEDDIDNENKIEFNECRKIYFEYYEKQSGAKPTFNGGQGANLKRLIGCIKISLENNNQESNQQNIFAAFAALLQALPDWYKTHLDINIIYSKYDGIITEIRRKSGASEKDLWQAILDKREREREAATSGG
jgi:uncharacterized protein YdaU (DUF1376 family)